MNSISAPRTIFLSLLIAGLLAGSSPAKAWVKICNKTGEASDFAFAWGAKDPSGTSTGGHLGVTAKGWWNIAVNKCAQVKSIDASQNWVYYSIKGVTSTRSTLCVTTGAFELSQSFKRPGDACLAGQFLESFERFDADKTNWTLTVH